MQVDRAGHAAGAGDLDRVLQPDPGAAFFVLVDEEGSRLSVWMALIFGILVH